MEERISRDPAYVLPRIVDLAVEFRVAYPTMWKALQVLVDKGVIASSGGRKLTIAGRSQSATSARPGTAVDALCDAIRERILDGIYKSGSQFPKAGYFAATQGVSYLTVSHAFARLASENLAHKKRSRWFVGPGRPPVLKASGSSDAPTILSVTEKMTAWSWELGSLFIDRYLSPFDEELRARHIRALPCLLVPGIGNPFGLPAGTDRVNEAARDLKDRYRGAIVRSIHPDFHTEAHELLRSLLRRRRPVVYFDSIETGASTLSRKALGAGREYTRMHLDLKAGVKAAITELARHGHRVIGIHASERHDWCTARARLIEQCAAEISPPLRVVPAQPAEPLWALGLPGRAQTFVESLAEREGIPRDAAGHRVLDSMRAVLLKNAASMTSLLLEHRPTALVALNDIMAWEYYLWFSALGIEIPRDLSIISFDNMAPAAPMPISSVDWGFRRLGYLAAHILIGDIPVSADRNGNIAGKCFVNDHGSVGRPADPARLARRLRA